MAAHARRRAGRDASAVAAVVAGVAAGWPGLGAGAYCSGEGSEFSVGCRTAALKGGSERARRPLGAETLMGARDAQGAKRRTPRDQRARCDVLLALRAKRRNGGVPGRNATFCSLR